MNLPPIKLQQKHKVDIVNCVVCNKIYLRVKKRTNNLRINPSWRPCQAVTCSRECSRVNENKRHMKHEYPAVNLRSQVLESLVKIDKYKSIGDYGQLAFRQRNCRDCHKIFLRDSKHGKVCSECKVKNHVNKVLKARENKNHRTRMDYKIIKLFTKKKRLC